MRVYFTSGFKKQFAKLPVKVQQKFEVRIAVFMRTPFDRQLENHPLSGNLAGFRSFFVTGDFRVKFLILDPGSVKLIDIGRHPHVYGH